MLVRLAGVATLLVGAQACDAEPVPDDDLRVSTCNLSEPACADLPAASVAADALASIGVDLETTEVALLVTEEDVQLDTAGGQAYLFELTEEAAASGLDDSIEPSVLGSDGDVQTVMSGSCHTSDDGSWTCCCRWFGPAAGCACGA